MRITTKTLALVFLSAQALFAAGSTDIEPPVQTPTTEVCEDGYIWDDETKACIAAEASSLTDEMRYHAVRELAYSERYASALIILEQMPEFSDSALTYRGFVARKTNDWPQAVELYTQALYVNPDNILARSYLGQGHVARGEFEAAKAQLYEIRSRDGAGTWPEVALAKAIQTGLTLNY